MSYGCACCGRICREQNLNAKNDAAVNAAIPQPPQEKTAVRMVIRRKCHLNCARRNFFDLPSPLGLDMNDPMTHGIRTSAEKAGADAPSKRQIHKNAEAKDYQCYKPK